MHKTYNIFIYKKIAKIKRKKGERIRKISTNKTKN